MGLFRYRAWSLVSVALILTLSTSGLLHSVIPHGDTHSLSQLKSECEAIYGYGHCDTNHFTPIDSHEQASWNFIHALLAHEAKKTLVVDGMATTLLFVIAIFALAQRFAVTPRTTQDRYEEALTRGVLESRRFA